jgi:hypothetical protein
MTRLEKDLLAENLFEYWEVDSLDFQIEAVRMKKLFERLKINIEKNPLFVCSDKNEKEINFKNRRIQSRY